MKKQTLIYLIILLIPILLIGNTAFLNIRNYDFYISAEKNDTVISKEIKKELKKAAKDSVKQKKKDEKLKKLSPEQLEKLRYKDSLKSAKDSIKAIAKAERKENWADKKNMAKSFISNMINDSAFAKNDTIPQAPLKKGKKSRKLTQADEAFDLQKYAVAYKRYKKMISNTRDKKMRDYLTFRMAESARRMNNMKYAETSLGQLIRRQYYNEYPLALLYYADALKYNGKFDKAFQNYELYNKFIPDDQRGILGMETSANIKNWLAKPTKHQIKNVKGINTKDAEFAPTYTNAALNELAFTTNRDGVTGKKRKVDEWTDKQFTDIFISKQDNKGKWSKPVNIDEGSGINTASNEGAPMISPMMNTLYFTRCFTPNKESKVGNMGCKILNSKRAGQGWGEPSEIVLGGDSTTVMGQSTFNNDETIIFFSGRLANCFGGTDLYMAVRDGKGGEFKRPVNLGEIVNTKGDECFPFLRYDSILYFASNGHPGFGGLDLYKTYLRRDKENKIYFTPPENLKYPLNTNFDDFGIVFAPGDIEQGYFSSNRKGTKGGDDIWSFYLEPIELSLSGRIKDESTLQPLSGVKVVMKDLEQDKTYVYTSDDRGNYSFNKNQFLPNKSYEITLSKDGYFTKSEVVSTGGFESTEEFIKDLSISPIPRKPVVLPEILFELGKAELRPQFGDSLRGTIRTLELNPTIVIELGAHTDMIGSEESNDILSQKRAESVMEFLIKRGIDPARIIAKGYGERVPRTMQKNIKREGYIFKEGTTLTPSFIDSLPNKRIKDAANSLNRRIEFTILRSNYKPSGKVTDSITKAKAMSNINVVKENLSKKIPYTATGKKDTYRIEATVEGIPTSVNYMPNLKISSISSVLVEQMLQDNIIDRSDFNAELENVVDSEGKIKKSTKVRIPSIKIGGLTVYDLELDILITKTDTGINLNNIIMAQFGSFTMDSENKFLIFK